MDMFNRITSSFNDIFPRKKPIIGVVHLPPLPGAPNYGGESIEMIFKKAFLDANELVEGGVDGLIIENFWDSPFKKRVRDPLTISSFAILSNKIIEKIDVPVGLNILRNSAIEAAAIAHLIGAKFIRVNVYVETVATDSGLIEPAAPMLLEYMSKNRIKIGVFADVHVKHGKPIGKRDIIDTAKDALTRGQASALILTGERTGEPPHLDMLKKLKSLNISPIIVGSGLRKDNLELLQFADGAIVGTYFKKDGKIYNPVDKKRVRDFINAVESYR